MANETVAIRGYREFHRACGLAERESKKFARDAYREVGNVVRADWSGRIAAAGLQTSSGLRTYVRTRGVSVEQSRRKTTGRHPEFGPWQMRRGIQALQAKEHDVNRASEQAVDRIADHFAR